jgi:hypothetical protein
MHAHGRGTLLFLWLDPFVTCCDDVRRKGTGRINISVDDFG